MLLHVAPDDGDSTLEHEEKKKVRWDNMLRTCWNREMDIQSETKQRGEWFEQLSTCNQQIQ